MVDRKARDKLAEALRQFASGRTTNDKFEEIIGFPMASKDRAVRAIQNTAYCLYDDLEEHRLSGEHALAPEGRHEIARWILFLQTNLEYEWPRFMPTSSYLFDVLRFFCVGSLATRTDIWPFIKSEDVEDASGNPRLLKSDMPSTKSG